MNKQLLRTLIPLSLAACAAPPPDAAPDAGSVIDPSAAPSAAPDDGVELEGHWYTGEVRLGGAMRTVSYQIVHGRRMFEGDIELPARDARTPLSAVVNDTDDRWPNAVIPYVIQDGTWTDPTLRQQMVDSINAAMADWTAKTGVQFQRATGATTKWVSIHSASDPDDCHSNGIGSDASEIYLGARCAVTAAHELGHVIGLFHEMTRHDRDQHVTVHLDNTDHDSQFDIRAWGESDTGPYDFKSVMHYDAFAFSTNGRMTMTRNDAWGLFGASKREWRDNVFDDPRNLLVGDFDGDGVDDVVRANGTSWELSKSAKGGYVKIGSSGAPFSTLRAGQFDSDPRADILYANGAGWYISSGGTEGWQQINTLPDQVGDFLFGDFNCDGQTDMFRGTGAVWQVSWGGRTPWQTIHQTTLRTKDVRLGNFVGDCRTDVLYSDGSKFLASDGGKTTWVQLASSSLGLNQVAIVDVDGDGYSDLVDVAMPDATHDLPYYGVSKRGSTQWLPWNGGGVADLDQVAIGNFDGAKGQELLVKGYFANPPRTPDAEDYMGVERIYFRNLLLSHEGRSAMEFWDGHAPPASMWAYWVGDFDGDGADDLFEATGSVFRYKSGAQGDWKTLRAASETFPVLKLGDFVGDKRTDVLRIVNNTWAVSDGGVGPWVTINGASTAPSQLQIADFNGDGVSDVFYGNGTEWVVSYSATSSYQHLAYSSIPSAQVRVGDFDGDRKADVVRSTGSQWLISSGGNSDWKTLGYHTDDITSVRFGHFDTTNQTLDAFRVNGNDWEVSWSGATPWNKIGSAPRVSSELALGNFDGQGGTDVLTYIDSLPEDDWNPW